MKLLTGGIAIFGLGFVANELTSIPTLIVAAGCLAMIVIILVVQDHKFKVKK